MRFAGRELPWPATKPFLRILSSGCDLIARYQLSGAAALHMLARLSAGYIHQLQQAYNQQGADVVVEEDFQQMLTAYLTSLDMSDVAGEMERMRNMNLN